MARIRTIKPDFFKHEGLAELSGLHRLLFVGLWTLCDLEGRTEDRPKRIRIELLPYDNVDVDVMLGELASYGFIVRYKGSDGCAYISVPSFREHQRIGGKEATEPSKIPPPPGAAPETHRGSIGEASGQQQGLQEGKGREGGKEGKEGAAESATQLPPPAITSQLLSLLREAYPHEAGQFTSELERRWCEAYPAVDLLSEARRALAWEASNKANRKKNHVSFLARWFSSEQDRGGRRGRGGGYQQQPAHEGGGRRVPNAAETRKRLEDAKPKEALPPAARVSELLAEAKRRMGQPGGEEQQK